MEDQATCDPGSLHGGTNGTTINGHRDEGVDDALPKDAPRTVDELIRARHLEDPNRKALVFALEGSSYSDYTIKEMDLFAYASAKHYSSVLPARQTSDSPPDVVAMLGLPNFAYFISMLALAKLGHATLLLSPRLSYSAYAHLLRQSDTKMLLVQPAFDDTATKVSDDFKDISIQQIFDPLPGANEKMPLTADETNMTPTLDPSKEHQQTVWMLHSSGSTAQPKLVRLTNRSALVRYHDRIDYFGGKDTLTTLPIFHVHGMSSFFRAILTRSLVQIYDPQQTITLHRLREITDKRRFQLFSAVPYTLKLLADSADGVDFLRQFEIVTSGGGPMPEDLGNRLVEEGVSIASIYGSSEAGVLLTSARPKEDSAWNWLRPAPGHGKMLRFEAVGSDLYELVVPKDWPPLVERNQADGSWNTRDLFQKHPSIPNAWKYSGRIDDVIVLENGEKANPSAIEEEVSKHALVETCVMFGAGKSAFGLAIIPSEKASTLDSSDLMRTLWPHIDRAQKSLPAYARLGEEMVLILPSGSPWPRSDKGTIIRHKFYSEYAAQIEEKYRDDTNGHQLTSMSKPELTEFLALTLASLLEIDVKHLSRTKDFFAMGMDSLQATRLRSKIIRTVNLSGANLGLNVVFKNPTVDSLAGEIFRISSGAMDEEDERIEDEVQALIEEYSQVALHVPAQNVPQGQVVVLTGATGSLGAHVLSQLLESRGVTKIYCLARASSDASATSRVKASLTDRKLGASLVDTQPDRVECVAANLSEDHLGLSPDLYSRISETTTTVLHCGWKVNFNQSLQSFVDSDIRGLRNLLNLCTKVRYRQPAQIVYFSSIGTSMRSLGNVIPEEVPEHVSYAQTTGYSRSKFVAEHLCRGVANKVPGFRSTILRIGQIVGDRTHGVWNPSEASPLMLQSATTIGCLPQLDEEIRWLPVDDVAKISIELAGLSDTRSSTTPEEHPNPGSPGICKVYNVSNPRTIHWTKHLLPLLRDLGLPFEELPPTQWLARLERSEPDPARNPPVKLIEYYRHQCGSDEPRPRFQWAQSQTLRDSATLAAATAPDRVLLERILGYLTSVWAGTSPCK